MNFIVDNLWKIIFSILLVVGGWMWWEKKESQEAWDRLVGIFAEQMDPAKTGYQLDEQVVQADYWRLLAKIREFEKGVSDGRIKPVKPKGPDAEGLADSPKAWLFYGVFSKHGLEQSNPGARLWTSTISDNLDALVKLGVFNDAKTLPTMLDGKAPTLPATPASGQFAGEKLKIINKVPALLAREGRNHPANFTIVPASVAAMIGMDVDEKTRDSATQLSNAKIIKPRTMDAIRRLYEDSRK